MTGEHVTDEALLLAARTDPEAFTRFYPRDRPMGENGIRTTPEAGLGTIA